MARVIRKRGFEYCAGAPLDLRIPARQTEGSAGYDFVLPKDIVIKPGRAVLVKTYIKAYMRVGEHLKLYPRSSIGVKKRIMLANTVGVIDKDFYNNPDNEGNISAMLVNTGKKVQKLKKGERFMQGVFEPYLLADGDNVTAKRTGGTGSTGE